MTPLEFEKIQKDGLASLLQNQPINPQPTKTDSKPDGDFNFAPFLAVLNSIRLPKRHLTTPPTFTPQNFADQIQIVDDGVTQSLYVYINQTWVQIASGFAAGNDTEIQFNDNGVLGGNADFVWFNDTEVLKIGTDVSNLKLAWTQEKIYNDGSNTPQEPYISFGISLVLGLGGSGYTAKISILDSEDIVINPGASKNLKILDGDSSLNAIFDTTSLSTSDKTFTFPNTNGMFAIIQDSPPSSASDTGIAGAIAYDSDYLYVCIATNTWKRTALSTW